MSEQHCTISSDQVGSGPPGEVVTCCWGHVTFRLEWLAVRDSHLIKDLALKFFAFLSLTVEVFANVFNIPVFLLALAPLYLEVFMILICIKAEIMARFGWTTPEAHVCQSSVHADPKTRHNELEYVWLFSYCQKSPAENILSLDAAERATKIKQQTNMSELSWWPYYHWR